MHNLDSFKDSLNEPSPPSSLSVHLKALWHDRKGDWDKAHSAIQDAEDKNACWIHAYLHRKEGDIPNADYWYRKSLRKRPDIAFDQEWEEIAGSLFQQPA